MEQEPRQHRARGPLDGYFVATAAVALCVVVLLPFRAQLDVLNVLLIFLVPCVGVALTSGVGAAVFAAVLGFLALNLFFIPPYLTLLVAAPAHVPVLLAYLGVGLLTGVLAARVRERGERAEQEQRRTAMLYDLSASLVGGATRDDLFARIAERVRAVFEAECARILLPRDDGGGLEVVAAAPAESPAPDEGMLASARLALGQRSVVKRGAIEEETARIAQPILAGDRAIGVLAVERRGDREGFTLEDEALLATFAAQAALALERARLAGEAANAAALAESDAFKSTLLATVSHDLRTPLASIKAAATSLLDQSVPWDAASRREFLEAIDEETDRLTLMVTNLLDLSRVEGGALRPQLEWYDAAELIADVAGRFEGRMAGRPMEVHVEPALPLLRLDYVQIAQVLTNLLDNALKYSPVGSPVRLEAAQVGNVVVFSVRDSGPGIAPEEQRRLFETFYRGPQQAGRSGSGLGLAICKGLVEAHGGRIWVESAPGAGAAFRFALPIEQDGQPA